MINFLMDVLKGILIGIGAILPGISSGVICVIFGIYEKLIDNILNFFKDVRNNFKFLFPIFLGGIIGIILASKILQYALYKYEVQTKALFIGFVLGGIFILYKDINKNSKIKFRNIMFLLIALVLGIIMTIMKNKMEAVSFQNINSGYLVLSGFLMSMGIVIPGVSSTIILMILKVYPLYLRSISNLYLPILIPIGLGIIVGSIIFMKLIKILLNKYYIQTMYSIIGFILGSILVLVPTITNLREIISFIIYIFLGYYVMVLIRKID